MSEIHLNVNRARAHTHSHNHFVNSINLLSRTITHRRDISQRVTVIKAKSIEIKTD